MLKLGRVLGGVAVSCQTKACREGALLTVIPAFKQTREFYSYPGRETAVGEGAKLGLKVGGFKGETSAQALEPVTEPASATHRFLVKHTLACLSS